MATRDQLGIRARRKLTRVVRRTLAHLTPHRRRSLTSLANCYGSDKGTAVGERHGYSREYEGLFSPLRHRPITILEIGLRFDPYYRSTSRISPSLAMWRDWFSSAHIYGFDINDFSAMSGERIHIFQGDQGNAAQLLDVALHAGSFDIVIDDGSHASFHQRVTLETLFRHVRPEGLYIVEDLHWQPPDLETMLPRTPRMIELLRDERFLNGIGVAAPAVELRMNGKLGVIRKPAAEAAMASSGRTLSQA